MSDIISLDYLATVKIEFVRERDERGRLPSKSKRILEYEKHKFNSGDLLLLTGSYYEEYNVITLVKVRENIPDFSDLIKRYVKERSGNKEEVYEAEDSITIRVELFVEWCIENGIFDVVEEAKELYISVEVPK